MILLSNSTLLPEVFRHLPGKGIELICEMDYRIDLPTRPLGGQHRIALRRSPLLVFGKTNCILGDGDDVIQLPAVTDPSAEIRLAERYAVGAEPVIRRFAVSGGLVCNPLLLG